MLNEIIVQDSNNLETEARIWTFMPVVCIACSKKVGKWKSL